MERLKPGHRWPAVCFVLAALTACCLALLLIRVVRTREPDFAFLVWNLALAWVPFVLALGVYRGYHRQAPVAVLAILGLLWLLFLPNAPYITTDFVHLQWSEGVPIWFDAAAVSLYAATGLLLGFASLYLIQAVAAEAVGRRTIWSMVVVVLWLSSVGIYLGRYQRLNSWDALRHPHLIAGMVRDRLGDPFANPTLLTVMVVFTLFLTVAYVAAYLAVTVVLPRIESERSRANR